MPEQPPEDDLNDSGPTCANAPEPQNPSTATITESNPNPVSSGTCRIKAPIKRKNPKI